MLRFTSQLIFKHFTIHPSFCALTLYMLTVTTIQVKISETLVFNKLLFCLRYSFISSLER